MSKLIDEINQAKTRAAEDVVCRRMEDLGLVVKPENKPFGDMHHLIDTVIRQVMLELQAAAEKFPTWPTDPLHALAVLGEEYGELNKAVLQLTYEPRKEGSSLTEVRKEAIQTAAMALRFVMSLDKYNYCECEQHVQGNSYEPDEA